MEYQMEIGQVVEANVEEIRGDLDQARHALKRTRLEVGQIERTVAFLESLLELAGRHGSSEGESQSLTLHEAMTVVLESVPEGKMRAGDLAIEVDRRGLYKMRDGRPVEAQQIHARVGHYPHLFVKEGTFIALADQAAQ